MTEWQENTVRFDIIGKPFGKQRPRHTAYTTYTPKETKEHEKIVRGAYYQQVENARFREGAYISLEVCAYMPIPKNTSKVKRELMLKGEILPTVKPDWDNIGKLIADALNGVAYDDDKQIVEAVVIKRYATAPHTTVRITGRWRE